MVRRKDASKDLQHLFFEFPCTRQITEGHQLQEVGEAPARMQQDGQVTRRANRNVRHAAKFNKGRRKGKRR